MSAKAEKTLKRVVTLKAIAGGMDFEVNDWLKELAVGTIFLYRPKIQNDKWITVMTAEVLAQTNKSTYLYLSLEKKGERHLWVDHKRFSEYHELHEIIGKKEQEDERNSDRSD